MKAACHALIWIVAPVLAGAAPEAPRFARAPEVAVSGQETVITFEADRPTDVAVFIGNSEGATIRHLAAGVLGPNAPAPFVKNSLAQRLVWDGRDDNGLPAERRGLGVHVGLGLTPAFEGLIGNNPADIGNARAFAPGPDGTLYVVCSYGGHHPQDGTGVIVALDRNGRYLRTLVPFSADLPEEKLQGVRYLRLENGSRAPFVYQFETRSVLPGLGDIPRHRPVVTPDGMLAFVGIQEGPRCFAQPGEARLTMVGTDGRIPTGGVLRTRIHPLTDTAASLALAPDGKTFYAAGVRAGLHPCGPEHLFVCDVCDHGGRTWEHTVPVPLVYSFSAENAQVGVFLGAPDRAHKDHPALKEPVGVAVDAQHNIYVADRAAGAVYVFSAAKEYLRQIKVPEPLRVEVHRGTGAIYVLCGTEKTELVKYDGLRRARRVWRLPLKTYRWMDPTRYPLIALDDSADPPVIWCSADFVRIEDHGDKPGEPAQVLAGDRIGDPAMACVMELSLDRVHGQLYVNNTRRYDLTTGEYAKMALVSGRMWPESNPGSPSGVAGLDGCYYVNEGARHAALSRFTSELQPSPFAVSFKNDGKIWGFAKNRGQGHIADRQGNTYVLWKKTGTVADPGDFHRAHVLSKYDAAGALLNAKLIDCQIPGISSPRLDPAGNIYVAVAVRPGVRTIPEELAGQVREGWEDPDCVNRINAYPVIYGSVVKFGPGGGAIRNNIEGAACNYGYGQPIQVSGAEWIAPGVSVINSWSTPKRAPLPGNTISCMCESPCIDVDEFGRAFFPDAGRARVGVLDSAGNAICTIGRYGNRDSTGLSFWWPQAVAVGRRRAYVGDRLNRRIVVARLDYAVENVTPIAE